MKHRFLSDGWLTATNDVLAALSASAIQTVPRNRMFEDVQGLSAADRDAMRAAASAGRPIDAADAARRAFRSADPAERVNLGGSVVQFVVRDRSRLDYFVLQFADAGPRVRRGRVTNPALTIDLPNDLAQHLCTSADRMTALAAFETGAIKVDGRTEQLDAVLAILFPPSAFSSRSLLAGHTQ